MANSNLTVSDKLSDSVVEQGRQIIQYSKDMAVIDNQTNKIATDFLRSVKDFQKKIKEELRPGILKAHDLHKHLVKQEKDALKDFEDAEQRIKLKINAFINEQEQIRIKAQREAQAKADAEEKKRREELERQAKNHEAKGNTEKAEERRQMAEEVHVPVAEVASDVEQQKGLSQRDNWTATVLDDNTVINAVLDGHLPPYCVKVDPSALKRLSKLQKKAVVQYGVRFFNDKSVQVRG